MAQTLSDRIKSETYMGTGINAVAQGFEDMGGAAKGLAAKSSGLGAGLVRGAAGGLATAPTSALVGYAGDKASNKLVNHYVGKDQNTNYGHAAIAAAPTLAAGVYGTGAMMHGMDKGKELFRKGNTFKQNKHILGKTLNPWEHIKRGVREMKEIPKAFTRGNGMKFGTRLFKGSNALGLLAAGIPIYNYISGMNKKKQAQMQPQPQQGFNTQQANNNINNLSTNVTQAARFAKVASYENRFDKEAGLPVLSPLYNYAKKSLAIRKYKKNNPFRGTEQVRLEKEKAKHLHDAVGQGIITGGLAYGGKLIYDKFTQPSPPPLQY